MTVDALNLEHVGSWGYAIVIAASVFLALWVLRWVANVAARRMVAGARPDALRALPVRLVGRMFILFPVVVALFAGSLALDLIAGARFALRAALVVTVVLQVGLWGNEAIRFTGLRYQARAGEDAGVRASVYGLSFIAMLAMWLVLFIVALDNMGVQVTALIAGLGIGGIAIALAAQNILGDLFASLVIIIDRPFAVGDPIVVADMEGTVEHIGIKTTRVRSITGEQLVFPNNSLVTSRIRNYRQMADRHIEFSLHLPYSVSLDSLERAPAILRETIEEHVGVRFERAHVKQLAESAIILEAAYTVLSPEYGAYMNVQHAINLAILRRFDEVGLLPDRT